MAQPAIPDQDVDTIAAMGFPREVALEALHATGGDVNAAIAVLIGDN
jgi:NACalpha-BTF3-like transcription factor